MSPEIVCLWIGVCVGAVGFSIYHSEEIQQLEALQSAVAYCEASGKALSFTSLTYSGLLFTGAQLMRD